jgi:hypothetical protein
MFVAGIGRADGDVMAPAGETASHGVRETRDAAVRPGVRVVRRHVKCVAIASIQSGGPNPPELSVIHYNEL